MMDRAGTRLKSGRDRHMSRAPSPDPEEPDLGFVERILSRVWSAVMTGILFLAAVIAAVAAVVFFAQSRSSGAALLTLKEEQAADRKATEGERTALKDAQAELKQRSQQLVELREKLSDQKKRVDQKQQKSQPRAVREAELEEDLGHARELAEEAHKSEQDARKQAIAARAALAQKESELTKAQEKVRELSSRPAASAAPAAPQASSDAQPNPALVSAQSDARRSEEKFREAMARLTDLEAQLGASRDREGRTRDEGRKAKGRAETNNRAFLIAKGELELMKERLAQAERRLWQAGLSLPKPAAPERPKATGPASADRIRAEPAGATALDAQSAASDAAAHDAAPEAQTTAAALESSGPDAVVPVRRRPAQT
jgi:peptidoglycan hydrolase CwlO-like protein